MNKNNFFIKLAAILLSALMLTSCGAKEDETKIKATYILPDKISSIKSGILAENENIELSWDMEMGCVMLRDKMADTVWSTIPYGYYTNTEKSDSKYVNDNLCSALQVKYIDGESHVETDINSNSDADYVMAQKLEKGIRLTYFFDKVQISIPISYRLENDGVSVSVEVANIGESENKVYQVSLLPFFASAENNTDSYIFVPSGSGALMYVDDNKREARDYAEPVYGEDAGNQGIYRVTESETVRMPVFGAKNGNNALLGIITSGAETAEIRASAGNSRFGFSGVYATFNVRGKAAYNIKGNANTNNRMVKYSAEKTGLGLATVKYTVLCGNDSDYNGMARYYRSYLEEKGMTLADEAPDAILTLLGGVKVRRLALGIPYYTVSELTTFPEAKTIVEDIVKETDAKLAVNLKGFGTSGLDSGKYAGGFTAGKAFGGKKRLNEFSEWCKNKNIDSFFDFDTVFFTENFKDFKVKNAAKSANDIRAKYSSYDTVKNRLNEKNQSYIVDRYSFVTSANSIISAANVLKLSGVGLSTLSSVAFSDYSRQEYYCKAYMSNDVQVILEALGKKNIKTFGESANDYAAARLDYVFGSPTSSSSLFSLDMELPFYQMVFRGYTGLSGSVINLSENSETEFLNSVLTGTALAFTLAESTDSELAVMTSHSAIGSSIYDGLKNTVKQYINEAKPLYEALGNSTVEEYKREDDVAQTVFSNGIKVIVNFSDNAVKTELGIVEAKSFTFSGKAGE